MTNPQVNGVHPPRPPRRASFYGLGSALVLAVSTLGSSAAAQDRGSRDVAPGRVVSGALRGNADLWSPSESLPLLIETDFEDARVGAPPRRARQTEVLNVTLPSGEPAPVPIFYEDGNASGRFAKVVPDPEDPSNQVLQYWLKNAQIPQGRGRSKGRIQLVFSDFEFTEASERFRMYLHPDLEHYRDYPGENTWFTINELWFGERWEGDRDPFRITVTLAKDQGAGQPLRLLATGEMGGTREGQWLPVWYDTDPSFEVPIGEWIDVEIGYRQGDASSGRFYVAMKRPTDARMVRIVDIHNWTYNPRSPRPVPMTNWNPLKVYTSGTVINHVRNAGGVVQLFFDDLEVHAAGTK